ncbi:MAG TPA: ATP-binding protein [Polyangia bacterium]|nr:ATP-binding protein [Polyangia bacterium]
MPHALPKSATVWIVDDSPLDAERARRVLHDQYDVRLFADGSALLEHLATHPPPDVLVLDWVMPGVSGIEVCRFLRSAESHHGQLAILLLTMQTQTEQIVEGLGAGANDYLVKPYADPELRARVDALVRWCRLRDRAQRAEASVVELVQHAPDPLIGLGPENRITFVNEEAQRVLGQSATALKSQTLLDVLPTLAPLDEAALAGPDARPLPDIEIGEEIFSPSVRFLPTEANTELTIALRNVTVRRQRETRRLDFYSMIAHDLRSPLSAMLMRTDLILRGRRGVLSSELVSDLRKMEVNMRGLVALINDFLDFARMEEGAHKMERSRFDLTVLLGEIVDDFRPLIESTHQELRIEAAVGQMLVLGDRRRLQQVLTNLIANAIKFTPAGGVIVVRAAAAGHWCEVQIEDTGAGIDPAVLPTLFQRYTRAPGGDAGGTGLGLMIVREIVEAHGGSVGVESAPGKGSRFWFRLPGLEVVRAGRADLAPPSAL